MGMSLSEFECSDTIALHWCMTNHRITWVCVHGTDLALRLGFELRGLGNGTKFNWVTQC